MRRLISLLLSLYTLSATTAFNARDHARNNRKKVQATYALGTASGENVNPKKVYSFGRHNSNDNVPIQRDNDDKSREARDFRHKGRKKPVAAVAMAEEVEPVSEEEVLEVEEAREIETGGGGSPARIIQNGEEQEDEITRTHEEESGNNSPARIINRKFFGGSSSQNTAEELAEMQQETEEVVSSRTTNDNGNSATVHVNPYHALRTGGADNSGAVIHRGGVGFGGRDMDSPEEEQVETRTFGRHSSTFGRTSSTTSSSSNTNGGTRGVRRKPGGSSSFSRNNNHHNNHDRKQRRGLKQQARKAGGGTGGLKGGGNRKAGGGSGVKGGRKERTFDPQSCNARNGKKCKRSEAEQRAGEVRGPHLTIDGLDEALVKPDFSLADTIQNQEAFALSNPELSKSWHATFNEKRFFHMPQASVDAGVSSQTIAEDASAVVMKQANKEKKAHGPDDHDPAAAVPNFVPRAIPNRYGRVHNQHSYYGGPRNKDEAVEENAQEGEGEANKNEEGEELEIGNYYKEAEKDTSWITSYYRARHSFYAEQEEEGEQKEEETARTDQQEEVPATDQEGGAEDSEGSNLAMDNIAPPPMTVAEQYAAWFNEMEDGIGDSVTKPATSTFSTKTDAIANTAAAEEGSYYYNHIAEINQHANDAGDSFFEYSDSEEDEDEEEEEDGEEDGDGEYVEDQAMDEEKDSFLNNFESSGTGATHHPGASGSWTAGSKNGMTYVTQRDHYPGQEGMEQAQQYNSADDKDEDAGSTKSSLTLDTEQDESGRLYYTDKVTANPVYLEAKGSTDLSTKKQEVFDSLTPLLSQHLEANFGEGLIEDYQLTITYLQSEDSVLQLRRGSEAKTYVTELVVLVVLHLRNPDKALVESINTEMATEVVDEFFDPYNARLKTFLRILNAEGIHTKEIYGQNKQKPPRNHAMEHSISQITPTNITIGSDAIDDEVFADTDDEEDEVITATNFFGDAGKRIAIIASLVTIIFIILAVLGGLWCHLKTHDYMTRYGGSAASVASDLSNEFQSRAKVSLTQAKYKIRSAKNRFRRNQRRGYFSLNYLLRGGGRSTASSVVSNSDDSMLNYIQPAAIQRRNKKQHSYTTPMGESPLEGRQDDTEFKYEDPKKPSSIYDIDINDDTDLRGTRKIVPKQERSTFPDQHDKAYDSESSDDNSSDEDVYSRSSQLSRLSLDRISIARSAKEVEDRNSSEEETRRRLERKQEREKEQLRRQERAKEKERKRSRSKSKKSKKRETLKNVQEEEDDASDDSSFISRLLNMGSHRDKEGNARGNHGRYEASSSDEESAPGVGRFEVDEHSTFVNNSVDVMTRVTEADEETSSVQNSIFGNLSVDTGGHSHMTGNQSAGPSVGSSVIELDAYTSKNGAASRSSTDNESYSEYISNKIRGSNSSHASGGSSDPYRYSQYSSSVLSDRATKGRRSENPIARQLQDDVDPSHNPISPPASRSSRQTDPNEALPLSPLSSALQEALADSPKPLTYTASRPRTPHAERQRRRAVDPPESRSSTGQFPRYGARMSPPNSMKDIMPDEYINRERWQDDSSDSTAKLPDHLSSAETSRAASSSRHNDSKHDAKDGIDGVINQMGSVSIDDSEMGMTIDTRMLL